MREVNFSIVRLSSSSYFSVEFAQDISLEDMHTYVKIHVAVAIAQTFLCITFSLKINKIQNLSWVLVLNTSDFCGFFSYSGNLWWLQLFIGQKGQHALSNKIRIFIKAGENITNNEDCNLKWHLSHTFSLYWNTIKRQYIFNDDDDED